MDRARITELNRAALIKLKILVASLSDAQYALSVGDGWTVGATLAHLAFWDQRAIILLERWETAAVGPSEMDVDVLNRACLPQWNALPPRTVAELVLATAEKVDKKLETVSSATLEWLQSAPEAPIAVIRAEHRGEHIDQIEQAIKAHSK